MKKPLLLQIHSWWSFSIFLFCAYIIARAGGRRVGESRIPWYYTETKLDLLRRGHPFGSFQSLVSCLDDICDPSRYLREYSNIVDEISCALNKHKDFKGLGGAREYFTKYFSNISSIRTDIELIGKAQNELMIQMERESKNAATVKSSMKHFSEMTKRTRVPCTHIIRNLLFFELSGSCGYWTQNLMFYPISQCEIIKNSMSPILSRASRTAEVLLVCLGRLREAVAELTERMKPWLMVNSLEIFLNESICVDKRVVASTFSFVFGTKESVMNAFLDHLIKMGNKTISLDNWSENRKVNHESGHYFRMKFEAEQNTMSRSSDGNSNLLTELLKKDPASIAPAVRRRRHLSDKQVFRWLIENGIQKYLQPNGSMCVITKEFLANFSHDIFWPVKGVMLDRITSMISQVKNDLPVMPDLTNHWTVLLKFSPSLLINSELPLQIRHILNEFLKPAESCVKLILPEPACCSEHWTLAQLPSLNRSQCLQRVKSACQATFSFLLKEVSTGKCLQPSNCITRDRLTLKKCEINSSVRQQWRFRSKGLLVNTQCGLCAQTALTDSDQGRPVEVVACEESSANQIWHLRRDSDKVKIQLQNGDGCLRMMSIDGGLLDTSLRPNMESLLNAGVTPGCFDFRLRDPPPPMVFEFIYVS